MYVDSIQVVMATVSYLVNSKLILTLILPPPTNE